MIEIKYDSDLENDIDMANSVFNPKYIYSKTIPFAIIMATGIYAAFGFDIIPLNFANVFYTVGGSSLIYFGGNTIANKILKNKYNKMIQKATNHLHDLEYELNVNNGIDVPIRNLKEGISEDVEITKTEKQVFENNDISKEEKVSTYTYVLDDNDEIKTIAQVATTYSHNNVINSIEYETFLLEEEDLKNHSMPVKKRIVRK